jgi:dihydrofolate reductase
MDKYTIVCQSRNGTIGYKNTIPWDIPEELKRFRNKTINNVVVMGKNTWASINYKPLKDRVNIIVSKTLAEAHGAIIVPSIEEAIIAGENTGLERLYFIGGFRIYEEVLDKYICDYIDITTVDLYVPGDIWFPGVPNGYSEVQFNNLRLKDRLGNIVPVVNTLYKKG